MFESQVRELINKRLKRGKLECRTNLAHLASEQRQVERDDTVLQQLAQMTEARVREDIEFKAIILDHLAKMDNLVARVRHLLPKQVKIYQERLYGKLQEALGSVYDELIRLELTIFAKRINVDEELSRFGAII